MKPAQKLKGARLEAGQTQERDDASLLAHREESEDAVKSCRAFLRCVLVTVYRVVWGFLRFGWAAERMQWGTRWWYFMPFSR